MAEQVRHLVLDVTGQLQPGDERVALACGEGPVGYDRRVYTYLTMFATCPACLVAHGAWAVAFQAGLELRGGNG